VVVSRSLFTVILFNAELEMAARLEKERYDLGRSRSAIISNVSKQLFKWSSCITVSTSNLSTRSVPVLARARGQHFPIEIR
jgi:hypothetical protein